MLGNPSSCRIARKFPKLSYYAMLSLASSKQGLVKYIHAMMKLFLSLWTYVFLNKTTKSMNLLGGMGLEWWFLVEWLHKAHIYGIPCVSHLFKATQEQRDLRCHMLRSF